VEDITEHVLRYREAARHLWNCFLHEAATESWPALHDWEGLKQGLFTTLVLRRCGHDDCAALLLAPDTFGFSWVKPIAHVCVEPTTEVPVMVSRDPGHGGYWDHPVNRLGPGDAEMRFIDFFDWDQDAMRDFQYYHVAIESCSRHPALAGHEALLEVQHGRVFALPVSPATLPRSG
jgi:hypothetical protein